MRLGYQTKLGSPRPVDDAGAPPPLKWAGGKRWLVEHLKPIWSDHTSRRLVEPFVGGLSVALGLRPKSALLNDINPHLVNFYKHLRRGLTIEVPGGMSEETYYSHRNAFNDLIRRGRAVGMHDDGRRAAMLFYYLNRHCYNGLCRFNKSGEFNTPIGSYVNPKFQQDLREYVPILKHWQFTSSDFRRVELLPTDFVYADPPYDNAYTNYSKGGFSFTDQKDLAEMLAQHPGPVVLSNHATDDMMRLYTRLGFDVSRTFNAPRMIHCFGDRTPAREVLATRNV